MTDLPALEPTSERRVHALAILWAVATLVLVAATWPLWTPLRDVPRVPVLGILIRLPAGFDFFLLGALVLGCVVVLVRRGAFAPRWWALGALALLLACDQLRFQPWAYHLLLWGAVLRLAGAESSLALLRVLAVSVYAYAAIAKLDYAFASTLGRQMIDALLGAVGVHAAGDSEKWLLPVAVAMPVAEGLVALLLAFTRTRQIGLGLATVMHLTAVLALSSIGLHHQPGVLLWNLVFLVQTWLLFYRGPGDLFSARLFQLSPASLLVALAVVGPVTRPAGIWDRWPSWGLYAPGGEMTEVYVHNSVVARLPSSLPIAPASDDAAWRRVELDKWMLQETHAPLYPQRRTTLALALYLQRRASLGDFVQVVLSSPADRWTGQRTEQTLLGTGAIRDYTQRYWLNTTAR